MRTFQKTMLLASAVIGAVLPAKAAPQPTGKTAYDFTFDAIDGTPLPMAQFKGKVLLVVNTASQCGFTPQYATLEKLYLQYKDKGLVVLGVPSNDFNQETGSEKEIKTFCEVNYGVTFPLTSKTSVLGDGAHPFYRWAKEVLGAGAAPKWNFHKYLVDRQGRLVDYFGSMTSPGSGSVTQAVERLAGPALKPSRLFFP